jgi:asparagine synthase (glutamine-hydrolysing)
MSCRGPDDAGLWIGHQNRIGLAHRRLSIIDLSDRGAQPMANGKKTLRLVYNGEIYNYRALRTALENEGYVFQSDSDTEVLLHLYDRYGRDMVNHLRGMYAFALWDERRSGLFIARDPYGIKPLYVADTGSSLHIASQVDALRRVPEVETTPNPAGHVGFFLWGSVPEPHTLYDGIDSLPAGHTMWVDREGCTSPKAFAQVSSVLRDAGDSTLDSSSVNGKNQTAYSTPREALRAALLESVRRHLIADVDVGLFLSAGLDSATLTALSSELTSRIRTITLGFEEYRGTQNDEVPGAEALASHYDTDHDTVWITQQDFAAAHDELFAAMDQPTIDGVNSFFVSRAASEAGFKVALSGVGGDELFGGYPSFSEIPPLVNALGSIPGCQTIGQGIRSISAPILKSLTSPKYAGIMEYGHDYPGAYLLRRGLYMPWELPELLDPDFARVGWESLRPLTVLGDHVDEIRNDHLRITGLESVQYMRNQLLRDTDWASMAHSLEVRTPLVDWKLLKQVAPLIARHDLTKRDMAQTVRPSLPSSILNRRKSGFTVPVRQWLLNDRPGYQSYRGLRGWARYVYEQFVPDSQLAVSSA